uniref:Fibronectin type-III domain-containing protein n=1 Tax=Magallana gigas TaxID=29159 RepID=A0A8W8J8N7_MAGGI
MCKDKFVLVNDTICRTVDEFKAIVRLKNVIDNSILVDWTTLDISGVDVCYEIVFNTLTLYNISSPPQLITNLSNGEVQAVQVTSIAKRRDDRIEIVMSDVFFIRTEPGPPTAVELVDVGQRNISINVTDTDTPNGDIIGYRFHIMYKLYPDKMGYSVKVKLLNKMNSNIYVLERHIYPGTRYKIAVFTVNDAFNSSLNVTLQDITTLPDTPGQVDVHTPSYIYQKTSLAVIIWRRPSHPNGNMKAYRAVLESGPDITNCRIYYLCFDVCNNTILGPPNDTCTISNDTTLMEHQKIMSLLVDNLRQGTTYTLSVVGYNEAGEGKNPRLISLTTKRITRKRKKRTGGCLEKKVTCGDSINEVMSVACGEKHCLGKIGSRTTQEELFYKQKSDDQSDYIFKHIVVKLK